MSHRFAFSVVVAALFALSAIPSIAADKQADTASQVGGQAQGAAAKRAELVAKRKAAAKVKLIDINSAKKAELKKLPGIGDAEADKIVAGRPYGSKAWLVSNNVISDALYAGIKSLIVAKQPFKEGSKNAAVYTGGKGKTSH